MFLRQSHAENNAYQWFCFCFISCFEPIMVQVRFLTALILTVKLIRLVNATATTLGRLQQQPTSTTLTVPTTVSDMHTALDTSSLVWHRVYLTQTRCGPSLVVKNTRCRCVFALLDMLFMVKRLEPLPLASSVMLARIPLTTTQNIVMRVLSAFILSKVRHLVPNAL